MLQQDNILECMIAVGPSSTTPSPPWHTGQDFSDARAAVNHCHWENFYTAKQLSESDGDDDDGDGDVDW